MPAPPGEVGRNAMVVNTEVDYRDEDDLTQTDIGHGAGGSSNGTKARAKEQRERLDLLTQRTQLQIKLERVEKTNQALSRQNTYLSSLLPRHHQQYLTLESDHDDPSSSSSHKSNSSTKASPAPTIAQLQVEIVDLKRENNALRYTFFGETPSVNAPHLEDLEGLGVGEKGVKQEEEPILTPVAFPKVEQGVKIAGQSPTSLANSNPNSNSTVDLRAVLQRVKDLYTENIELAGLLVGESSSGSGKEDDREEGRWAEVVRESRMMITSLDADLDVHSQEISSLRSRVKELETELELERARKQRMKSMSRSRSRSRPRSVSRGRSMSRSRSRSVSRSRSRSRGRSRSRTRSPSASRSASQRSRSDSRRSSSRSRSRHRNRSSSPRNSAYHRESRSDRRRNSSPGRSLSPRRRTPEGSQRARREMDSRPAAVPPPRSSAGGSNWRTAHGISDDADMRRDPAKQTFTDTKSPPAPVAGGFSILGASARSAPRELLPPSPRREDRDPPSSPRSPGYGRTGNRRGDNRNQGSRGGGRGRGGRSRSPRRDEVRDGRDRSRQRQPQGRWREEDRYRPESGRRPSINERLNAPLPDGRNGRRRGGPQSRPRR